MNLLFAHIDLSKKLILLFLWLTGSQMVHAQLREPQPRFHHFSINDGLPSSETYFVYQDKKGYIWIATDHGVARFDGYKFQVFTTSDGLTDNVVFRIFEDYKGRIWFVTYNSRLCYFENEKIKPYKYNNVIEKVQKTRLSIARKTIYIDKNDNLYFSLHLNGLWIIDKYGNAKKHKIIDHIEILKVDDKYIFVYDYPESFFSKEYIQVKRPSGNNLKTLRKSQLRSFIANDYLLVDDYLYNLLSKSTEPILKVSNSITLHGIGKSIWVGTLKNGIFHVPDMAMPNRQSHYLQGLSVSSVMRDKQGGYWFTTLEKGVFYSPSLSIKSYSVAQGLLDNEVTSIGGIKDNVYLGFLVGRWQNLKYPDRIQPHKMGFAGTVIGSSHTKFYMSAFAENIPVERQRKDEVFAYWNNDYFKKDNSVIFGGYSIIQRFDDGRQKVFYNNLADTSSQRYMFNAFMMDARDRVWAGSISGLFYVKDGKISSAGLDDPLFQVRVSDLEYHPNWKNIVATRGEGIYFFEGKQIFKRLTTKDGLLSDLLNVLFMDESGGIWAGSNKGLNHITKDKNGKIHIESFTILHGLCSNEISSVYVYNGLIYVGTKSGLSVIDTKSFSRNKEFSRISLTFMEAGDRKLNPHVHNLLEYREPYVKIGFRNSNYRTLGARSFQYRFNKSSKWISTTIPEISLISPFPGEYDLEIRYLNEDGLWSAPSSVCIFTVDDAFYNKWYFLVGIGILLALISWFIFKYRIKQLKQRHMLNNKINQLEQKALQAQMNPHFIFNALNSIQSFLVYEENEKAEKYLLKFAQLIRQTLNNSREQYITIESEIKTLEKYLELEQMRFKNKFTYRIENALTTNEMFLKIPNMLIQPFVENAIIHGFSSIESGGEIVITMKPLDEHQILCIVADNGIGRKKAMEQSASGHVSHGLNITEERLRAFETRHGISFRIETEDLAGPGGATGTRVLINLPLVNSGLFESE